MARFHVKYLVVFAFLLSLTLWIVIHYYDNKIWTNDKISVLQQQLSYVQPYLPQSEHLTESIVSNLQSLLGLEYIPENHSDDPVENYNNHDALNSGNNNNEDIQIKPKIAYIFAGSARSFACPHVHWSIKSHLIDALGGDPYVFIRLSLEDNINTKTGTGILKHVDYNKNDIINILSILNPKKIQYFTFSTQLKEMESLYPDKIHSVFRKNDLRRYSMFYHRCQAYKLAIEYEEEHNIIFDWVVLVRLDAAWLEPILPIEAYDNDRVWITQTGYDVFNDQFMLIPRQYSDYLYDLNSKVQKGVYCLGGPDVETWKCNTTTLLQHEPSINKDMLNLTLEYCCKDNQIGKSNVLGMSEAIHKRHLEYGKIPVSLGRFPVFLTRRYKQKNEIICHPECFRIYALHYSEYIYRSGNMKAIYEYMASMQWPDRRSVGVSARDRVLCYYWTRPDVFPWKPLSAASPEILSAVRTIDGPSKEKEGAEKPQQQQQLRGVRTIKNIFSTVPIYTSGTTATTTSSITTNNYSTSSNNYYIDYSKPLYDPIQRLHPSILLNPKDTEVWRIHPTWNTEGCLTFSFITKTLSWEECYDHSRMKQTRYDSRQLFFLYVLPIKTKNLQLQQKSYHIPVKFPSTTYNTNISNQTRIVILDSEPQVWDYNNNIYCITVEKLEINAKVYITKCSEDRNNPLQLFNTIYSNMDGSLPQTQLGKISLYSNSNLCIGRSDNALPNKAILKYKRLRKVQNNEFILRKCHLLSLLHLVHFEFELINS